MRVNRGERGKAFDATWTIQGALVTVREKEQGIDTNKVFAQLLFMDSKEQVQFILKLLGETPVTALDAEFFANPVIQKVVKLVNEYNLGVK